MNRLFDVLDTIGTHDKPIALAHKKRGIWKTYSAREYIDNTYGVSHGLLELGISKGDRIASITNDRPEWNFIDLGIQQIGAIHVPINFTASDEEIKFILNETESKIVFVSSRFIYSRLSKLLTEIPQVKRIFTFASVKGADNFEEFILEAENKIDFRKIDDRKKGVKPDDNAAILYTSGTSSFPKGVMLTHRNLTTFFLEFPKLFPVKPNDIALSPIPLSHIGARKMNYEYQFWGLPVYYTDSTDGLAEVMKDIKPGISAMVPLFLEKIHYQIVSSSKLKKGLQKSIYKYALLLTQQYDLKKTSLSYKFQLYLADIWVYKKWRKELGGRLHTIISGGAAIPLYLLNFFWAIKIPVYEIYGMTETSSLISVNRPKQTILGSVGIPYNHVEVKLAEDGELICKGPNIMEGYFKKPELTSEVIDQNGFFHTGDIGEIDKEGFIKITGRKKDMFKTISGEFISPNIVENKLKQSSFIHQIMIVGANRNFLSALVVPEFDTLQNWCQENDISIKDIHDLIENNLVTEKIQFEINKYNTSLFATEKIEKFLLLKDKWTVQSGELSSFMKLKRNYIEKKYKHEISNFYE